MTAASEFISENMRKDFLIVGGAALVRYGSSRNTRDIDIAITSQTLQVFWEKAHDDSRFSLHPDGPGVEGLQAEFEFLMIGEELFRSCAG